MKKQLLLISTLIFAGTSSAMAWNNIDGGIDGYTYSDWDYTSTTSVKGSNNQSGVTNSGWNGKTVDLGVDASYTLSFNIYSNAGDYSVQPLFNVYLSAPNNSILFGNYYGMGANYDRGPAGVFRYAGDVSGGDLVNGSASTYILNRWVADTANGGFVRWHESTKVDSASNSTSNLVNGYHSYTIIIEAFADSNQKDKIKFKYSGPNGDGWTADLDISSFGGIAHDRVLGIGWFTDEDGGTMRVDQATFDKSHRTLTPVVAPDPEPEVPSVDPTHPSTPITPDVPEPSAFGLLAGLGAIVLAVSRRRRK